MVVFLRYGFTGAELDLSELKLDEEALSETQGVDVVPGVSDAANSSSALDEGDASSSFSPARFVRRQVNRARKLAMCGEGFSLKGANTWIRRTAYDRRHKLGSTRERRWAHRRGFSVSQVKRFDITSDNIEERLSERDYDFLYPINGKYGKWLDDRVTARLVAGPLHSRFEQTHFNIISRNGELLVIPLSDAGHNAIFAGGGALILS